MLNQKKVEIFSRKFRKSLAKQFLEIAYSKVRILRKKSEFIYRLSSSFRVVALNFRRV